jgi:hypothetical protein
LLQAQQALVELQHQNDELTALLDKTAQQVSARTRSAPLPLTRRCSARTRSSMGDSSLWS